MTHIFNSKASILWTPDGLYILKEKWELLNDLSLCPKSVNLYMHGFPTKLEHQKLPPMNPMRQYQVLKARLHHEVEVRQANGWGMITHDQKFSYLTTNFLNGSINPPPFKEFGIMVNRCHWLSFAFESLMSEFQNQQPCGGILALGQTLNNQWQILFGQGKTLKLVRMIPFENQIESMLQETLHYCLNEYGIDPADIKLLNLTDINLDESYELEGLTTSKYLEDIFIKRIRNKSLLKRVQDIFTQTWEYPQNDYPFGEKPNPAVDWCLKTACVCAFLYLFNGIYDTRKESLNIQDLENQISKLSKTLDNLQKPMQLTAAPDWEILERFKEPMSHAKLFERLKDLEPIAQDGSLIQEFLWTQEEGREILKIRYNDHPEHLNSSQDENQLHELIFNRLQSIWGENAQVEFHNNRIEVLF